MKTKYWLLGECSGGREPFSSRTYRTSFAKQRRAQATGTIRRNGNHPPCAAQMLSTLAAQFDLQRRSFGK